MIKTPYLFEPKFSDQEFMQIGRFAIRWSHIDHTIGNCLRRLLDMSPKHATVMIFPLSLDHRISHIEKLAKRQPMDDRSANLFAELKPLIKAMQFVRNTALHGVVIDLDDSREPYFELRSRGRHLTKSDILTCDDLINYTAHVTMAFRLSLGDKDNWPEGDSYALPDRPPIPEFLPAECRTFPPADRVERRPQPDPSRT